jgi:type II secretory pathway pseudopilin PulG
MEDIPQAARQVLLDYALGQLPPEQAQRVGEQLAGNPHWARFVDRVRQTTEPLDRWPAPPAPADLVGRTLRAVREQDRRRAAASAAPKPRRHLTFTLLEVVAVAASVVLVAFLLLPSLYNAQVRSLETACGGNLRTIGQVMATYADRHHGELPTMRDVARGEVWHKVGHNPEAGPLYPDDNCSNTRALWRLVRAGLIHPKRFVCPVAESFGGAAPQPKPARLETTHDFQGPRHVSYSYQITFGRRGLPRFRSRPRDPQLPLLADRSPMFDEDREPVPADPTANSPNHAAWADKSPGQLALFSDQTVRLMTSPQRQTPHGVDNIWTPAGHPVGEPLTGKELPADDEDVLLGP